MEDFIISETRKIFWKAINRFGENDKVDPQETSILMGLEREDGGEQTLTYRICYHHIPVRETNIMELLGVKIDLKMYSLLVPPQIKKILDLTSAEISMAVAYLYRQGSVDRIKIDNEGAGPRQVWAYQHKSRL